jgi:hypothetical protein
MEGEESAEEGRVDRERVEERWSKREAHHSLVIYSDHSSPLTVSYLLLLIGHASESKCHPGLTSHQEDAEERHK